MYYTITVKNVRPNASTSIETKIISNFSWFYTVFDYFAKNSNSDWIHNLYRKLSDELSMNKILDQMDQ